MWNTFIIMGRPYVNIVAVLKEMPNKWFKCVPAAGGLHRTRFSARRLTRRYMP